MAAAKGPVWFQLYPRQEMSENQKVLEQVQAAGCRAVVVTVDQQASAYERALHDRNLTTTAAAGRSPPAARNPYGIRENRLWYEWKLFDELRRFVHVPMLAKGNCDGRGCPPVPRTRLGRHLRFQSRRPIARLRTRYVSRSCPKSSMPSRARCQS